MTRRDAVLWALTAMVFGIVGGSCASTAVSVAGEDLAHPHPRGVCVWYSSYVGAQVNSPELGMDGTVSCRQGSFVTIEPQRNRLPGP